MTAAAAAAAVLADAAHPPMLADAAAAAVLTPTAPPAAARARKHCCRRSPCTGWAAAREDRALTGSAMRAYPAREGAKRQVWGDNGRAGAGKGAPSRIWLMQVCYLKSFASAPHGNHHTMHEASESVPTSRGSDRPVLCGEPEFAATRHCASALALTASRSSSHDKV